MAEHHKKMILVDWVIIVLLLVGGLNWGLIGWFNFNLISQLFANGMFPTVLYAFVGLATVGGVIRLFMKK